MRGTLFGLGIKLDVKFRRVRVDGKTCRLEIDREGLERQIREKTGLVIQSATGSDYSYVASKALLAFPNELWTKEHVEEVKKG